MVLQTDALLSVGRRSGPDSELQKAARHVDARQSAVAAGGFAPRAAPEAAFDKGNLRGNNFGILAGISYSGSFTFGK